MSKKKYIFIIAGGIITALIFLLSFTIINILPKLQTNLIIIKQSILALKEISGLREDLLTTNVPVSEMGIDYYAQGGIVVDGIAYFTGNWKDRRRGNCYRKSQNFPYVVSFDVKSFKKIKTFNFYDTYDSAPLVVQKKTGTTLIIAHEHLKKRTKAINVMTGNTEWLSEENQPGHYFFGYSYFNNNDGTTIIFGSFRNGLHAISAENGKDLWTFSVKSTGGVTPCVDQKSGFVYYQFDGGIVKLNVNTGRVVKKADVSHPNRCISWNTVLIDDEYGYYIATYWYGRPTGIQRFVFTIKI